MRGRLFAKILIGFWLTLFCIVEGLWLLFVVRSGAPSPEEWFARRLSPPILSLLAHDVASGGPAAFEAARRALPPPDNARVSLRPLAAKSPVPSGADSPLLRGVSGPDGKAYLLTYTPPRGTPRPGTLLVPWQTIVTGAIAGLIFSVILAWYLTRPINILRRGFDSLAQGDLDVRLRHSVGRRRDEIADLARDFDAMAARLEQLVTARDRLLHDVSHELRSPLSRLQLAIGLARQNPSRLERSLDRIEQEAIKLDAMVRELLVLARAESGAAVSDDYFDPIAVLEGLIADASFEAQAGGIRVVASLPELAEERRPSLKGSAELFRRALENIIRNALRFSPPGGRVTIDAEASRDGAEYRFTVSDEGPGVDEAALATLFDPFVTADQGGFGLGLAIAKRAVVTHGGTISARNLPAGGFCVAVTLPSAKAEDWIDEPASA